MKQLKPGQICTMNGRVYQCAKFTTMNSCLECCERNNTNRRILIKNHTLDTHKHCYSLFGANNYPLLIK